jgi:hypothetical protein
MDADTIIQRLNLSPHPEGGFYRETFRHRPEDGGRGAMTVIYYLLREGEFSAWHRVDATEVWHYCAGGPLRLHISEDGDTKRSLTLGANFGAGHHGHAVVPENAWQAAESLGPWTLVGCTVAPAFQFEGFEMAPDGWSPETPMDP